MKYSKFTEALKADYLLQPQDVFFSVLVASGCSRAEAYAHIYRPLATSDTVIINAATALIKKKPAIARLIADLELRQTSKFQKSIPKNNDTQKTRNAWDDSLTAEENLQKIIKGEIGRIEGKDKISASLQYAKLIGVNVDSKETTHYYLPLSCRDCSLYKEAEK